jgi:hypothetical protein
MPLAPYVRSLKASSTASGAKRAISTERTLS